MYIIIAEILQLWFVEDIHRVLVSMEVTRGWLLLRWCGLGSACFCLKMLVPPMKDHLS